MQSNISLDKLKIGEKAYILEYLSTEIPAKFFELGFIPGTEIEVKYKAPFNGPIGIRIVHNNALIAIRKSEAEVILIDTI
ncbi:ferrous iron transport protein A [Sphingobacteriaceae bacterium WQ 2009]|uniref:Ferrous iron transport protein A n=1 Tax=Rhinopithecimicrobium faecis TaxID=2820698 RepID=A0A8T4H6P7_9SPHI|nr:ferrous iron transport protein A [Sphingobacteriaceae bacterium WQ 2009]